MYELDPWGEWRADLRSAAAMRVKYGGKIADYMPTFDKQPDPPGTLVHKARTAFGMFSPTVTRPSTRGKK
jgi:hypothetical protein